MVVFRVVTPDGAIRAVDFQDGHNALAMMLVVGGLKLAGFFEWNAALIPAPLGAWDAAAGRNSDLRRAFGIFRKRHCLPGDGPVRFDSHPETPLCLPCLFFWRVATSSNIGSVATITGNPQKHADRVLFRDRISRIPVASGTGCGSGALVRLAHSSLDILARSASRGDSAHRHPASRDGLVPRGNSHSRAVRSPPAVARVVPSGLNARSRNLIGVPEQGEPLAVAEPVQVTPLPAAEAVRARVEQLRGGADVVGLPLEVGAGDGLVAEGQVGFFQRSHRLAPRRLGAGEVAAGVQPFPSHQSEAGRHAGEQERRQRGDAWVSPGPLDQALGGAGGAGR